MSVLRHSSVSDTALAISRCSETIEAVEQRLLQLMYLTKERAQQPQTFDDLTGEFGLLAKDLRASYQQVAAWKERRDLTFQMSSRLLELERCCVWIHRKVRLEEVFTQKLRLEKRLRTMISAEAFGVYQGLLIAEDEERALLLADDETLRRQLMAEPEPGEDVENDS